jgi:dipeptidyl-peptidase-3
MGLALKSESAARLAKRCVNRMLDPQPANLGYPSPITQSAYYLSSVSKNEVQTLSKFILKHGIALENTRLLKTKNAEDEPELRILQASIEQDDFPKDLGTISDLGSVPVKVVRGDHARDLGRVSSALSEAAQYCASDIQAKIIACLQETFRTGNIEDNKAALKSWVKDADPVVDHVLGFVE